MPHITQVFAHLILFALWFGAHLTVLILIWQMRRARGLPAEQGRLARCMTIVERIPRTAFVLMLPMGLQLAESLGLFELGGLGALGAWIVALIWIALIWRIPREMRSDRAVGVRVAQRLLMVVIGVIMAGAGLLSILSGAPIAAPWLGGKFILYGFSLLTVFGLELVTQPVLYAAFPSGPRPAPPLDEAIDRAVPRTIALGLALYIWLLAASYLGLAQPG